MKLVLLIASLFLFASCEKKVSKKAYDDVVLELGLKINELNLLESKNADKDSLENKIINLNFEISRIVSDLVDCSRNFEYLLKKAGKPKMELVKENEYLELRIKDLEIKTLLNASIQNNCDICARFQPHMRPPHAHVRGLYNGNVYPQPRYNTSSLW